MKEWSTSTLSCTICTPATAPHHHVHSHHCSPVENHSPPHHSSTPPPHHSSTPTPHHFSSSPFLLFTTSPYPLLLLTTPPPYHSSSSPLLLLTTILLSLIIPHNSSLNLTTIISYLISSSKLGEEIMFLVQKCHVGPLQTASFSSLAF